MSSSQILSRNTFNVALANISNLVRVQLTILPSLLGAVLHVVSGCTEKQVIGSDAVPSVALVTNLKTFWDASKVNFPREAMRLAHGALRVLKQTVTMDSDSSGPQPARVGLIDLAPELFLHGQYIAKAEALATTELGRAPERRRKYGKRLTALFAGSGNFFYPASFVLAGARAVQRPALESGRRYAEVARTLLTGAWDSCYVSISHAVYVSIVEGVVRLASTQPLSARAVSL
jgi:hypothetical protein